MKPKYPYQQEEGVEGAVGGGSEAANLEDGFVLDLSGVPEQGDYPVLPRGMYNVVVDDVSYGLSQRSGNPMWTWQLEVEDGEYKGQKLFFHTPFTEKMMPRVKKVLARVAPELLESAFNPKEVAEMGQLVGKRAKVRVDVRKYEGQDRNNVRDLLPPENQEGGDFLNG